MISEIRFDYVWEPILQHYFIGIMCHNFHLDVLKTVERVWDTTIHQPPDC